MRDLSEAITDFNIQVVGNLNPAIFHMSWFRKHKILPEQEVVFCEKNKYLKHSTTEILEPSIILTPDFVRIHFESYLFTIQNDRLSLNAKSPGARSQLSKIVSQIFRILHHTPLRAVGNNFNGTLDLNKPDSKKVMAAMKASSSVSSVFPEDFSLGLRIIQHKSEFLPVTMNFNITPVKDDYSSIKYEANFHRDIDPSTDIQNYFTKYFLGDFETDSKKNTEVLNKYFKQILKG